MKHDELGIHICLARWREDPPVADAPVEDVAKRAFTMARDNSYTWFVQPDDDDARFRIGCGVLLIHYQGTPTYARLERTLQVLRSLSAATQGVRVDFGALLDDDDAPEPLPLIPWYKATA